MFELGLGELKIAEVEFGVGARPQGALARPGLGGSEASPPMQAGYEVRQGWDRKRSGSCYHLAYRQALDSGRRPGV